MRNICITTWWILFVHLAFAQVNLDSGMVGYYPFIGNADDSSGNGNNGIITGAVLTADRSGNANSAYYFDGSSHIDIPDDSSLQPTVYTLYALVKVQVFFPGTCQGNVILWKGRDTSPGHYGLIFSDTPYDWSCANFDSLHENFYNDQQHLNPAADTPYIYTNVWYCLVSTFDGDSLRMWVDGTLRYTAYRNPLGSNSEPLFIGYEPYAAGLEYWFTGVIDEIRIYNRVLNDAEINSLCFPNNAIASFTADNSVCPGSCIDFTNLSTNALTYQWYFPGAIPDSSSDVNPSNICYANEGSFDVQLIALNPNGNDTLLMSNYITVYPFPPPQSITQSGDTLFAIPGTGTYQWYFNGSIISGATNYFYLAQSSGDYNVVVTDGNGCEVEAAIFDVIASTESPDGNAKLTMFPNPVAEQFTIQNEKLRTGTTVEISIYNIVGEKIYSAVSSRQLTFDCRPLTSGMYWLEVTDGEKIYRTKFVKQ